MGQYTRVAGTEAVDDDRPGRQLEVCTNDEVKTESFSSSLEDEKEEELEVFAEQKRTGNFWTACAHIIVVVVGAGILSLPSALASLGWIAGPVCITLFGLVTYASSSLLIGLHEYKGVRLATYAAQCGAILTRRAAAVLAWVQATDLWTSSLAYSIAFATSMQAAVNVAHGPTSWNRCWVWTIVLAALQAPLAQLPSLDDIAWVSVVGALCSVGYASLTVGLSGGYVGEPMGTIGGAPGNSAADKVFQVCNALGSIAFCYNFNNVIVEIQNTVRDGPPPAIAFAPDVPRGTATKFGHRLPGHARTTRSAVRVSMAATYVMYMATAVLGYLAFGNAVPSFILDAFPSPAWLVVVANLLVAIHMIAAFQVMQQPLYQKAEAAVWRAMQRRSNRRRAAARGMDSSVHSATKADADASSEASVKGGVSSVSTSTTPALPNRSLDADLERGGGQQQHGNPRRFASTAAAASRFAVRQAVRLPIMLVTLVIAAAVPFFSDIVGCIGGLLFLPEVIVFPLLMHFRANSPGRWNRAAWVATGAAVGVVCVAAVVGSCRNVIADASTYSLFP